MEKFLLTRPSRGATEDALKLMLREYISTHTPLAGRDTGIAPVFYTYEFLLTRPSRGATFNEWTEEKPDIISTHTPLAGRDDVGTESYTEKENFYSHAPRGARHLS